MGSGPHSSGGHQALPGPAVPAAPPPSLVSCVSSSRPQFLQFLEHILSMSIFLVWTLQHESPRTRQNAPTPSVSLSGPLPGPNTRCPPRHFSLPRAPLPNPQVYAFSLSYTPTTLVRLLGDLRTAVHPTADCELPLSGLQQFLLVATGILTLVRLSVL
jgi:hypothetical protein